MTRREKIIQYFKDNGIDILAHEVHDKRYDKPGTILIEKWYCASNIYRQVCDLCTYNSPVDITTPYKKDYRGNIDWFVRDNCYVRISWKPGR